MDWPGWNSGALSESKQLLGTLVNGSTLNPLEGVPTPREARAGSNECLCLGALNLYPPDTAEPPQIKEGCELWVQAHSWGHLWVTLSYSNFLDIMPVFVFFLSSVNALLLGGAALHSHSLIPLKAILIFYFSWAVSGSPGKKSNTSSPSVHLVSSLLAWRVEPGFIRRTWVSSLSSLRPHTNKTKPKCKPVPLLTDAQTLTLEILWLGL